MLGIRMLLCFMSRSGWFFCVLGGLSLTTADDSFIRSSFVGASGKRDRGARARVWFATTEGIGGGVRLGLGLDLDLGTG